MGRKVAVAIGPFDRGRAETNMITRKTNEGKDRMNRDRDLDLKGLSVTHLIMGVCRRDRKEGSEMFEGLESHTLWSSPNDLLCSLNIVKIGLRKDFFHGKLVNHFLVRGTISFYNQNCNFCLLEKAQLWDVSI